MSGESRKRSGKGNAATWFLKKLITSPALYTGLLLGGWAGSAFAEKGPTSGAIGFGTMVGVGAAFLVFGLMKSIQMMHQKSREVGDDEGRPKSFILEELRKSGLESDAVLLEKIMEDRDAVAKRCAGQSNDADAKHTLALVEAIVLQAEIQAEELQDLARRSNDPLLEGPENGDEMIAKIRGDLTNAYQAVADARSRLRRGEHLKEVDFLADDKALESVELSALTGQLNNETAIAKRIEKRLHPEIEDRIVADDRATNGEELPSHESEKN